jgi:hypothetical protein
MNINVFVVKAPSVFAIGAFDGIARSVIIVGAFNGSTRLSHGY